jgi:hypothetical protein
MYIDTHPEDFECHIEVSQQSLIEKVNHQEILWNDLHQGPLGVMYSRPQEHQDSKLSWNSNMDSFATSF